MLDLKQFLVDNGDIVHCREWEKPSHEMIKKQDATNYNDKDKASNSEHPNCRT